uniref:TIR domain-containing protein n=1 Tax=Elaeophora elaphi TaxID=1147741 RepID=A0A0R3RZ18_9BILA
MGMKRHNCRKLPDRGDFSLELDQLFSDDMFDVLDDITRRLKREVRVNLIITKINCAENKQSKCLQYSLQESFHWLIINDPEKGDIVYEITAKLNRKKAIIEASLLNVLSQHSVHDLTVYCSKEADKEVGFVRRLLDKELMEKQRKSKVTNFKRAILRSPLELNLIEPLLLEQRTFDEPLNWHQLQRMDGRTLDEAINTDHLAFILFWNFENIVSKHAFYLWAEASKSLVSRHPTVIFGALACHEFNELCDDYISKPNDYHTIFAFKKNDIFGKTKELRDAKYYIDWVQLMIISPAQEIHSDDELKRIKAGELKSFDEIRPAITVGIFGDRNSNEANIFMQIAENLKGRYHFVFLIKQSHPNTVYTIRVLEKRKRIDFTGNYEIEELTNFVVYSSLPSVIDISDGFTSDILTHQMQPLILFVDDSNEEEKSKFAELCAKSSHMICATIINR